MKSLLANKPSSFGSSQGQIDELARRIPCVGATRRVCRRSLPEILKGKEAENRPASWEVDSSLVGGFVLRIGRKWTWVCQISLWRSNALWKNGLRGWWWIDSLHHTMHLLGLGGGTPLPKALGLWVWDFCKTFESKGHPLGKPNAVALVFYGLLGLIFTKNRRFYWICQSCTPCFERARISAVVARFAVKKSLKLEKNEKKHLIT